MKKMLFILNPRSGKGQISPRLMEILDIFAKAEYEIVVHPTQCEGDAVRTAREGAAASDLIVCSGGDGTLDEVVAGLLQSGVQIPVGYIPAGSTNDFASSLGLPKDLVAAAHAIVEGKTFSCDIGAFGDQSFVYIAAFGMFTEVAYETDQNLKNTLGHLAYLLEASKKLFNVPSHHLRITTPDREFEGDFAYGMVTNTRSVGGMKNITGPDVELNDGLFEVTLVQAPKNPLELGEAITSLLFGGQKSPMITSFKTDCLMVEGDHELPWTLDGERGGSHQSIRIRNRKNAIQFLVGGTVEEQEYPAAYK